MKQYRLKRFLFHSLVYLLINIFFFVGFQLIDEYIYRDSKGSGDGNLWILGFIFAVLLQIFLGVVWSIIISTIKKHIYIYIKILIYMLVNSLVLLFLLKINSSGLFYNFIYATGGILILSSLIYSYLLNKVIIYEINVDNFFAYNYYLLKLCRIFIMGHNETKITIEQKDAGGTKAHITVRGERNGELIFNNI